MKREQEKKEKKEAAKKKSEKQKKKLLDLLGLPQRMLFKPQLQQLQPILLQLAHLILHRPMHRQQLQQKTPHLILQPDGGHLIGYIFTMRGRVPK
jgi:hypothetical protein